MLSQLSSVAIEGGIGREDVRRVRPCRIGLLDLVVMFGFGEVISQSCSRGGGELSSRLCGVEGEMETRRLC